MSAGDVPGRFGEYGGRYVPEVLIAALEELESAYPRIVARADFRAELDGLLELATRGLHELDARQRAALGL